MNAAPVEQGPCWTPTPRQAVFLASNAFEALYGGAAGGGKSDALVIGALRHIDKPGHNAIVFRRTFPELEGQVIPKSREWYPLCGGRYNAVQHCWHFPTGARIHFGHLQHESDVHRYQGWEFSYIGFDELTHFTEAQYTFLLSRARSSAGIPVRIRAATNPGGVGHEWVMRRWAPWLHPNSEVKAEPSQRLGYRIVDNREQWLAPGEPSTLSRVFIPATLADNPHLDHNDPGYRDRLGALDRVTREQLLAGNWLIKPASGAYFKRVYFKFTDVAPAKVVQRIRRWDLAATPPSETNRDPDWTVGVKMARLLDGTFLVEDVIRVRESPGAIKRLVRATAELDGHDVHVSIPQDPGQAGVAQRQDFAVLLAGYVFRSERETGDKETRAKPFSAQAEAGNVALLVGRWNQKFLEELEAFPDEGVHDDQVDAASGALSELCGSKLAFIASFAAAMRNR